MPTRVFLETDSQRLLTRKQANAGEQSPYMEQGPTQRKGSMWPAADTP